MSQLQNLVLHEETVTASQVVASAIWQRMQLPLVPKPKQLISPLSNYRPTHFGHHLPKTNWIMFCDFIKNSRVLLHACQAIACSRTFSFAHLNVLCAQQLPGLHLPKIVSQQQRQRLLASGGLLSCVVRKMNAVNYKSFRPLMGARSIAANFARGPLFGVIRRVKSAAATIFSRFSAPAVHQPQKAGIVGFPLHASRSSITATCCPRCNWPVMVNPIIMNPTPDIIASTMPTSLLLEAYREYICHRRFVVLNERDPHRRRNQAISLCLHLGLFGPDAFGSAGWASEFWPLRLNGACAAMFVEMRRVVKLASPINDRHYFDLVGDVAHGLGFPFVFQFRDLPALGVFEALRPVSHEAIVLAVRNGCSTAVVELLLVAGFSANSSATSGISLLGLASQNGFVHLVNLLIQWNADVNCVPINTDQALTPLFLAASNGHALVLRSLLRAGARHTADACAAARAGGYSESVELLVNGALDSSETSESKHARLE
jgi:hypothetical protein